MTDQAATFRSDAIGPEELGAALHNPDPFVRADALSRTSSDERLVEPIGRALVDEYPLVRREAVRALSRIACAESARVLVGVAAHDVSAEVREEAVAGLGGMLRVGKAGAQG